jgi:hypothetical protein
MVATYGHATPAFVHVLNNTSVLDCPVRCSHVASCMLQGVQQAYKGSSASGAQCIDALRAEAAMHISKVAWSTLASQDLEGFQAGLAKIP